MSRIKEKVDIIYNNTKKEIVIAHISDIHFNKNTKVNKLNKIKDYLIKMKPDYLMITGDLLDEPSITKNSKKIKELVVFLTDIAVHTKIIIGIGNHDVISRNDIKFFDKLDDLNNIYVLNNKSYQDEFIYVGGFTLPNEYYYNVTKNEMTEVLLNLLSDNDNIVSKLPKDLPKIALIHSPIKLTESSVLDKLKEYDLILCGHTHDGMVPEFLKFIFKDNSGIIAPNKKFFPKIAKGKIEKKINDKKITIVICGGITKLGLRSGHIFAKLNFVYSMSINKIIIKKGR